MEPKLVFQKVELADGSVVEMACQDGYYWMHTVRGDFETKLRFTPAAMEAFVMLYQSLKATQN